MRIIAITGGIGSGKTTVAGWIGETGVPVIDADRISRALTRRRRGAALDPASLRRRRVSRGRNAQPRSAGGDLFLRRTPRCAKRSTALCTRWSSNGMHRELEALQGTGEARRRDRGAASLRSGHGGHGGYGGLRHRERGYARPPPDGAKRPHPRPGDRPHAGAAGDEENRGTGGLRAVHRRLRRRTNRENALLLWRRIMNESGD